MKVRTINVREAAPLPAPSGLLSGGEQCTHAPRHTADGSPGLQRCSAPWRAAGTHGAGSSRGLSIHNIRV